MLRIDDTEEEVDLRPRRPPDVWRYEERGVIGAGDRETLAFCVATRGGR